MRLCTLATQNKMTVTTMICKDMKTWCSIRHNRNCFLCREINGFHILLTSQPLSLLYANSWFTLGAHLERSVCPIRQCAIIFVWRPRWCGALLLPLPLWIGICKTYKCTCSSSREHTCACDSSRETVRQSWNTFRKRPSHGQRREVFWM